MKTKKSLILTKKEIVGLGIHKFLWKKHPLLFFHFDSKLPFARDTSVHQCAIKLLEDRNFTFFVVGGNFSVQTISGSGSVQSGLGEPNESKIIEGFSDEEPLFVTEEMSRRIHLKFTILPKTETIMVISCAAFANDKMILDQSGGPMRVNDDRPGIYVFR